MGKDKGLPSCSSRLQCLVEERLHSENNAAGTSLPHEELQRLIHELQIQKIELVIQNEELRQSRDGRQKNIDINERRQVEEALRFDRVFEDGTIRTMLGDAVPLLDKCGRPVGAIGAFIDISERKRMENACAKANSV